jgi:hypothetical protein
VTFIERGKAESAAPIVSVTTTTGVGTPRETSRSAAVAASSLSLSGITGSSAVISQSRHFPKFAESRRTKAVVMQKDVQATAATILASAVRRTRLYRRTACAAFGEELPMLSCNPQRDEFENAKPPLAVEATNFALQSRGQTIPGADFVLNVD